MRSKTLYRGALLVSTVVLPRLVAGQNATVVGTATDSANHRAISGVVVTVKDARSTSVAILQSDSAGRFRFRVPGSGQYSFELRKLGYRPLRTPPIALAGVRDTAMAFAMAPLAVWLDTVVSTAQTTLLKLTPGREIYRQHMLENKGQFVSGLEIRQSKMRVSEYLGTLPGIRLSDAVPVKTLEKIINGVKRKIVVPGLASIPGADQLQLLANAGTHCLYGRVDRFFIPTLLLERHLDNIDDLLNVDDITGVEVYLVQRDMPKEWRSWMYLTPVLVPRNGVEDDEATAYTALMGRVWPGPPEGPCGFIQIWTRIAW